MAVASLRGFPSDVGPFLRALVAESLLIASLVHGLQRSYCLMLAIEFMSYRTAGID